MYHPNSELTRIVPEGFYVNPPVYCVSNPNPEKFLYNDTKAANLPKIITRQAVKNSKKQGSTLNFQPCKL